MAWLVSLKLLRALSNADREAKCFTKPAWDNLPPGVVRV
jgi:hypothetical protein